MKRSPKRFTNQSKRAAFVFIGLTAIAIVLVVAMALLTQRQASVRSYEQCTRAGGSSILESYPSVCVTRDGRRFTNPDEHVAASQLKISEWKLNIPLIGAISDASYTYDSKADEITLTTVKLESLRSQIRGCNAGLHALHYRHEGSKLVEQHLVEILCAPLESDATRQINQIQQQLRTAAESATPSN